MKVLIAGGGPTGLTLGIDLARRGVEVRVIDKVERWFEGSRGDGIQPRTLEIFEDLGVLDEVRTQGSPMWSIQVHVGGRVVAERRMAEHREATPGVPYPNPWVLGQSQLEGILRARLIGLGVRPELNTALTDLTQDDDGVTARLSTGETVRADYLVGADGGASTVRKQIGVAFPGVTDEAFRMLIGDVVAPDLDRAHGHWFGDPADPASGVVMTPLPSTDYFQFGASLAADQDASLEGMQAALDRFGSGVRLTGAGWSTLWRPNVRLAGKYRIGRVFLAGDAAHVHPPTGGQGMNTGVGDAYNLGWKLASETALDSYETERREVARRVLGLSTRLLKKYEDGDEDAYKRGEDTLGLDISYRTTDAEGLTAGDRAPDGPVRDAYGKELRLFDLFRGPHFTELAIGEPMSEPGEHSYVVVQPGDPATGNALVDVGGHVTAAYGKGRFTVRPDGYLAS